MAKRRRVMQRSIRLGRCICNPRLVCPCELLREQDVCPCAGERIEPPTGPVRLTRLVDKPGCASKIDQAVLRQVLDGLPTPADSRVLVGMAAGDDAGVFRFDGRWAWVQTVDVLAPPVDDPYTFGRIAAANSLSDIYAMGGEPMTALSIVGFPVGQLPDAVLREILRGGIDTMAEAGVAVIGGHSINDPQIKAGFAVTGLLDPARMLTNAAARAGDALVLTKPLGTGIISFAAQIDRASPVSLAAAAACMTALNRNAAALGREFAAHACTDVTGFGLVGHLSAMAAASRVDVEVTIDDLPLLPGVRELLAAGVIPGAVERNRESSGQFIVADETVPPELLDLCLDAQTSGGLLVALPADQTDALLARLREHGAPAAVRIGHVLGPGSGRVFVRSVPPLSEWGMKGEVVTPSPSVQEVPMPAEPDEVPCCADAVPANPVPGGAAGQPPHAHGSDVEAKFKDFLYAASQPGALDAYTKQAIAIALSLLARCEPCVKMHIRKAREKGFTQAEIDEAAWLAVSFGGAPLMVFYNALRTS